MSQEVLSSSFTSATAGSDSELIRGEANVVRSNSGSGTIQVQLSFDDGTTWVLADGGELTSNIVKVIEIAKGTTALLRFECTSYSSGTIDAKVYV